MERNSTLRDKQDRSLSLSLLLPFQVWTNERTNHAENEVIYEVENEMGLERRPY